MPLAIKKETYDRQQVLKEARDLHKIISGKMRAAGTSKKEIEADVEKALRDVRNNTRSH